MNINEVLSNLTEEQKEKAKKCQSAEELIALAQQEGIELTDEQLEGIAGGVEWSCLSKNCGGYDGCLGFN